MARRRKNEKRQKSIRYFDYSLLFLIIFLLCFGLIMLYSTSSYYGSTRFNDAAYYVKRQMYASALGIVAMLFISRIPYKFWMQLSTLAYFVALVLCTAVIFVGTSAKGQSRWLRIGPIQFQPSEIAKIAVIIFLATIIYKTPKRIGEIMSLLKIMLLISPVLAVVAYNNLSTAIIILGIAVCMLFVASPKYLQFILMGIGVCLFGALFILSLALKSLFFDEPLPSKNPDCANRSINAICVCLFHFCPEKCSLSNCISGIILDGVRGDVVKNKALFFRYAMCSPPGLIILYDNVHFIVVKTIFDIYGVVLIILVENIISI